MQTLNSWRAMFSEVPKQPESHKHFWECLSHVSFVDLPCGWSMGVEGRASSLGVFTEKRSWIVLTLCSKFSYAACKIVTCVPLKIHKYPSKKTPKKPLTWTSTFLKEHVFFLPDTWQGALGSQHDPAPAPPCFVPVQLLSVTFRWSSPSASILMRPDSLHTNNKAPCPNFLNWSQIRD